MASITIPFASLASGAVAANLTFDGVTLLVQSITVTSDRNVTVAVVHPTLGSFEFALPPGDRAQDLSSLGIVLTPQLLDSGLALPPNAQLGLREGS